MLPKRNSRKLKTYIYIAVFIINFTGILNLFAQENITKKEKSPYTDNYYLNLGILSAESNKSDSALYYISKSIEINKKNPFAYYVRATVFYELNRYDEALKDLNQAIKINPKDEKSIYLRAIINQSKFLYSIAAKDYEALIKINSKDSNYFFQYAYCLQECSEFQKSIDNYLQYEKLVKSPPLEFFFNIIYNYVKLKKYNEALTYIEKSEKNGFKSKEFIELKITILANNNKCNEAFKIYEENNDLIIDKSNLLNNLGICFLSNKKFDEAEKILKNAYEMDKSLVENLFNIAYIQQQKGNPTQTIYYLEQFVEESKNRNDLNQLRNEAIRQLDSIKKKN